VQQKLMRHANISTTMNVYGGRLMDPNAVYLLGCVCEFAQFDLFADVAIEQALESHGLPQWQAAVDLQSQTLGRSSGIGLGREVPRGPQRYGRASDRRVCPVAVAKNPYVGAFGSFLKFEIPKLIAVASRQLVLLCLDAAGRTWSIPDPATIRPIRRCRRAISCVVRTRWGCQECVRSPPSA